MLAHHAAPPTASCGGRQRAPPRRSADGVAGELAGPAVIYAWAAPAPRRPRPAGHSKDSVRALLRDVGVGAIRPALRLGHARHRWGVRLAGRLGRELCRVRPPVGSLLVHLPPELRHLPPVVAGEHGQLLQQPGDLPLTIRQLRGQEEHLTGTAVELGSASSRTHRVECGA
eukprot:scaffold12132_cov103-Isochrysis_galbana.AAC.5